VVVVLCCPLAYRLGVEQQGTRIASIGCVAWGLVKWANAGRNVWGWADDDGSELCSVVKVGPSLGAVPSVRYMADGDDTPYRTLGAAKLAAQRIAEQRKASRDDKQADPS